MYPSDMGKFALLAIAISAFNLVSCGGARKDRFPAPETEQVISERLKDLYMAAAAAAPQSLEQQKTILRMAQKASNGRELLLVMRAATGVFPAAAGAEAQRVESQVRVMVTGKMMKAATLNQLVEYAAGNPVGPEIARPFVERLFQLADGISDPMVWYRIKNVAFHLKVNDLEQLAQVRADQLASRSSVEQP